MGRMATGEKRPQRGPEKTGPTYETTGRKCQRIDRKVQQMSLYNMLFGQNPSSDHLLKLLGLDRDDFGRYRDVFVEDDHIVVHTRCGGGNRESYEYVFDQMSSHAWYSHNADCDFDCTYANIYFKIPEEEIKTFVALLDKGHHPEDGWQLILKVLEK